jgi:hypothetical protein
MSETITEAPVVTEAPAAVVETPATEAPAAAVTETPAAAEPDAPQPDAPKPRPRTERHVANLTARLAAQTAAVAAAEARAAAAEALLQSSDPAPPARATTPAQVDRAAVRAEIEFDTRRQALVSQGQQEFGADDWRAKTDIIHGLGATQNPAFMQALVELPNAAKIVAALAEDSDALMDILGKSPHAMAVHLGRMDARMDTPTAKPISNAPKPPPAVAPSAVVKEPDIYDEGISMKEWAKLMDARDKAMGRRRR